MRILLFSDERCGSFEDWDSRVEDFFLCHFFPAADKLIEIEAKIAEQKEADRFIPSFSDLCGICM